MLLFRGGLIITPPHFFTPYYLRNIVINFKLKLVKTITLLEILVVFFSLKNYRKTYIILLVISTKWYYNYVNKTNKKEIQRQEVHRASNNRTSNTV